MKSHGVGVAFDHVEAGAIRNNRIDYADQGCNYPAATPPVRVTNSKRVTVTGNKSG